MLRISFALIIPLSATMALGDVTPEEVWENWQVMSTGGGQELTVGNTVRNGDTLEVSDITITKTDPVGGTAMISFDKLSFRDNGDGTVTVELPESVPMSLAFPGGGGGENGGVLKLTISQSGTQIVAGGSATETRYDFTAPTTTMKLDEATDATGERMDLQAEIVLTDASGGYLVTTNGEEVVLDSSVGVKSLTFLMEGSNPSEGGRGRASVSMTDVGAEMSGSFLDVAVMANLAGGAGFSSGFGFGTMSATFDVEDQNGPLKVSASSAEGAFNVGLYQDLLDYDVVLTGAKLAASGAAVLIPEAEIALGEVGFNVMMPIAKTETAQIFEFRTFLTDLTMSEAIWALFDPDARLPRDPATVVFDVKGTGRWNYDIMAPGFDMEAVSDPGLVESLEINDIRASVAGLKASVAGALTFDNTGTAAFEGLPPTTGTLTATVSGAQALIDNLVALGALAEDEAQGLQFGLAMFARPGAEPDQLVSELEFKDNMVYANGMPLMR